MPGFSWNLGRVADLVAGRVVGDPGIVPSGVYIDSRVAGDGRLFVAIRGDRFDGHDFARAAAEGGAAAVLAQREIEGCGVPVVVAQDSLLALQRLGAARRRLFRGPVLAVTGSSGKTTTRSILAAIVSTRRETLQPARNFNNHIGVPLTLLEMDPGIHGAAVLELGCSDFGEISLLTELSSPDVGLVTNVGPAHLEKLGDLDGVARAKGELFAGLPATGCAVVNLDDRRVAAMRTTAGRRITFSVEGSADVSLIERKPEGALGQRLKISFGEEEIEARFALPGHHNAVDAVAACAAAMAAGVDASGAAEGLGSVTATPGRLQLREGPSGSILLDDTYNANPASVRAALGVLAEIATGGRQLAVLGDMLELGSGSDDAHLEVGEQAARGGLEMLVTMGESGRLIGEGAVGAGLERGRWRCARDHREAARVVAEILRSNDALLIKGSRGMAMEKVVSALLEGHRAN